MESDEELNNMAEDLNLNDGQDNAGQDNARPAQPVAQADNHGHVRQNEHRARTGGVTKLRMEGVPKFPSSGRYSYKFHHFTWDFEGAMALLGLRETLTTPLTENVDTEIDALLCRYLAAAITNPHVSGYIARTYAGRGRAAMAHLESRYGLGTLSYAELRAELLCDDLAALRDPFICVLMFEKVADQFTPAMTDREKSEHLIAKIKDPDYRPIRDTLQLMDTQEYEAIKEKFIQMVHNRQKSEKADRLESRQRGNSGRNANVYHNDTFESGGNSQSKDKRYEKPRGGRNKPDVTSRTSKVNFNDTNRNQGKQNNYKKSSGGNDKNKGSDRVKTKKCLNCKSTNHFTNECDKPMVTCSHPQCEGNHLEEFCWWRHPELIRNKDLREKREEMIAKYKREKGAKAHKLTTRGSKSSASMFCITTKRSNEKCQDCDNPATQEIQPKVLILFSGAYDRKDSLANYLNRLGVSTDVVDNNPKTGGGDKQDILNDAYYADLHERTKAGEFAAIFTAPPCSTFSISRFIGAKTEAGAPIVRDRKHITGLPTVPAAHKKELRIANRIVRRTASLLEAAHQAGADFALENPSDRGNISEPCLYQEERHGPIFLMQEMIDLAILAKTKQAVFAQCLLDSPYQKYTTIMYTPGLDFGFGLLNKGYCNHPPGSHEPAGGIYNPEDGEWNSKRAAAYPATMNEFIATTLAYKILGKAGRQKIRAMARAGLTAEKSNPRTDARSMRNTRVGQLKSQAEQVEAPTRRLMQKLMTDHQGTIGSTELLQQAGQPPGSVCNGGHQTRNTSPNDITDTLVTPIRKKSDTERRTDAVLNRIKDDSPPRLRLRQRAEVVTINTSTPAQNIIVDSGASMSVMTNKRAFVYIDTNAKIEITMGANATTTSKGVGKIRILLADERGETVAFERDNVIYSPDFGIDILSVRQEIQDAQTKFRFDNNRAGTEGKHAMILSEGTIIPFADNGSIYSMPFAIPNRNYAQHVLVATTGNTQELSPVAMSTDALMHARFGHLGFEPRRNLPNWVIGLPKAAQKAKEIGPCDTCLRTKQIKQPARASQENMKNLKFGDTISSDITGKLPASYEHGHKYLIVYVDHATGWIAIYGLKSLHADEILKTFKRFVADMNGAGKIKCLLTDGFKSYVGHEFQEYCDDNAIQKRHIEPHNHNSNGRAERAICTIMSKARSTPFTVL